MGEAGRLRVIAEQAMERAKKAQADHAERLAALPRLRRLLELIERGHEDDCGGTCRVDLAGHDCCQHCNLAEWALLHFVAEAKSVGVDLSECEP